jgi:uncharacterized surface protein with fasciclin (FAS1) repeats
MTTKWMVLMTGMVLALGSAVTLAGDCSASKDAAWTASKQKPAMDIVETAVSAGQFETLVQAVQQAGLVDVLKGDGPFTVFAPTDEAFAKVPRETLQALLSDKQALTKVLTYHVVPGKLLANDVAGLSSATTVQGQSVRFDTSDGVRVDGAHVVKADVMASNGVIHVIDSVILPN